MTIETKYNKGDAVKYWDRFLGWRFGNIQKTIITAICSIPDIEYVVDFSDHLNPKDIRKMKEYELLGIEEDEY